MDDYFFQDHMFSREPAIFSKLPYDNETMPDQCVSLFNDTRVRTNFVFGQHSPLGYVVIALMAILYAACLTYIFLNRKSIAFNSRSPKLLMIGIVVLCSDSILNTLIFSSSTGGSKNYRVKCILGIVATVIGLFGFLTSLTLRMYRVFKVFDIYKNYLDN